MSARPLPGTAAPAGAMARYAPLLARLLFAPLLFAYGAFKIRALMGSVHADALQSFPLTQYLLYLTIALELVGGLLIVIGYKTRWTAIVLALFFAGVTALMAPQVLVPGGMGASYLDQVLKNLAFIGGLVLLALHGPGAISLDAWRERSATGR